jgi:hypothetical protein
VADIFVSYAHEERTIASRLAARLVDEGWTVFWDRQLVPGDEWEQRIQREAMQARCVVALWSAASVVSPEVRKEATIGWNRRVLVPAFAAAVDPPEEFRGIHASNLVEWDGTSDTPGVADLIYAIACLIGNPAKSVTITPVDFAIVVCWKKYRPEVAPIVNLTCQFDNQLGRPVTIDHLEAAALGPDNRSDDFHWSLLYDTIGATEHKRRKASALTIPETGCQTGIQFRATSLNDDVRWPAGRYEWRILGWADRFRGSGATSNLRTDFEVFHEGSGVADVNMLLSAPDSLWASWNTRGTASDYARGVRARIGRVRRGLPAPRG